MKRASLSLLPVALLVSCLAGCDNGSDSTLISYDPRLDGVTLAPQVTPDLSILENQKDRYDREHKLTGNVAPTPAPATGSGSAGPASAPGALEPGGQPATPPAFSPPAPPAD